MNTYLVVIHRKYCNDMFTVADRSLDSALSTFQFWVRQHEAHAVLIRTSDGVVLCENKFDLCL